MANSQSKPVVVVALNGQPVQQVASPGLGQPATVVASLGMPIMLVTGGKPMVLFNADGTEYAG
jgi:hypothetical protein